MDNVDPLLRELLARADTYKARGPLTLYLPGGRVSGYAAEPSEFRSDYADRISERWEGYVSLLRANETNQSGTIGVCTRCAIHGRASENARAPNCQV
jgi:hypothetical protein